MKVQRFALYGVLFVIFTGCSYHSAQESVVDATKSVGGAIKSAAINTGDYVGSGFKKTGTVLSDGFSKTAQALMHPFGLGQEPQDDDDYRLRSDKSYQDLVEDVSINDVYDYDEIMRPANGHVVRGEFLSPFGVVLLIPFRPGVDVADNDMSDDIAIRIARGIRDVLMNDNPKGRYEVVFSEDGQKADFVINGYITQIKDSSLLQNLMLKADTLTIGVRGQMRDVQSDDVILTFTDEVEFRSDQISHKGLADIVGQNIARFILQNLE